MLPQPGQCRLLGRMLDEKLSLPIRYISVSWEIGVASGPCDPALIPAFPLRATRGAGGWCAWCVDTTTGLPWAYTQFLVQVIGAQGGWWEEWLEPC